jgi:Zinc finger, C3HC4 type (RING finger)
MNRQSILKQNLKMCDSWDFLKEYTIGQLRAITKEEDITIKEPLHGKREFYLTHLQRVLTERHTEVTGIRQVAERAHENAKASQERRAKARQQLMQKIRHERLKLSQLQQDISQRHPGVYDKQSTYFQSLKSFREYKEAVVTAIRSELDCMRVLVETEGISEERVTNAILIALFPDFDHFVVGLSLHSVEIVVTSLLDKQYRESRSTTDLVSQAAVFLDEKDEPTDSNDNRVCVICLENVKKVIVRPCNHVLYCHGCAAKMFLETQINTCSVCKAEIDHVEKVFF